MNLNDDISQFTHSVEQQKQKLQAAHRRRGERPCDRKPRDVMIIEHNMALMMASTRPSGWNMHSTFSPPTYLPCTNPVSTLKPTLIAALELETHHRGTYLLLRAVVSPRRLTAILSIVEDERGEVTSLSLYQQEPENIRNAADVIKDGSILLIKEPFFKVLGSGDYGLRVDHLSDIEFLKDDDDMVPDVWRPRIMDLDISAGDLKMEGNELIRRKSYWKAINRYSSALSYSPAAKEMRIIQQNRALAHLKTQQYDLALQDTGYPDFDSDSSDKALFRAAEALYGLGNYKECVQILEKLCKRSTENKEAVGFLERAHLREKEQTDGYGNDELGRLQLEADRSDLPHLDHATYIGPIEVQTTKERGRGLFLTQAAKAGDLLLCEKAFGHAVVGDKGNARKTLLMNVETMRGSLGGQADLLRILVQKMFKNPSLATAFHELHCGDYPTAEVSHVDGHMIIDSFLVEQIMSFNVFGCPDIATLTDYRDTIEHLNNKNKAHDACGVWIKASYINHDCIGNVVRSFIGDMMIVRAAKDMEPGTEITFPYQQPDADNKQLSERQEKFSKWGFQCKCAVCKDSQDTKASTFKEREKLKHKLKQFAENLRGNRPGKGAKLLGLLEKTYSRPAQEVPRLGLWEAQLMIAHMYLDKNNTAQGLAAVLKTLEHLGFVITGGEDARTPFKVAKWGSPGEFVPQCFLLARSVFRDRGDGAKARQAEEYARTAYRILVGEDATFEHTYAKHFH